MTVRPQLNDVAATDDRPAGPARAPGPGTPAGRPDHRVGVVVITHNRRAELLAAVSRLVRLPERPQVVVVDNASADGTAEAVAAHFPTVRLVRASSNLGAVGRNVGVRHLDTPYVAFCDDDIWWEPGAMARAADLLDRWPRLATVTGHIVVEPGGRVDPIVAELRDSPLARPPWLPGPALLSILAGASVVRLSAFHQVGGFSARMWLGGEEELFSADLAALGWWLCYAEEVRVHHQPSTARDPTGRRRLGIRNTLWFNWLRRPVPTAIRRTVTLARAVPLDRTSLAAFAEAVAGLPWVLRERQVLPAHVEAGLRLLERPQRESTARRYVG
jgi:GT2 family glycosyltransferase